MFNNNNFMNSDMDSWFDIGTTNTGCQSSGNWYEWGPWNQCPGQCSCGSCGQGQGAAEPSFPHGPGPVEPSWPHGPGPVEPCHRHHSKKICVSPEELAHIIEEVLESKEHGRCNREPKYMKRNTCCNNEGCLGYAPKRNYCECGNNYCGGNYGYNYGNYGNYGCGYDDNGIWWLLIIVFFFCGGFCFF